MDDDFMTVFFNNDVPRTEYILRIIMENPTLNVESVKTQYSIKNLQGRSVRLDVKAKDSTGTVYDIEIQQANKGAGAKRARYNSALIDADETIAGMDTEKLPESFVIFITENDVLGGDLPLYHIDRTVKELCYKNFGDGAHIIYVNGQYRGENPIGNLMHDFSCKKADDMKSKVLAEKVRYLKEDQKGVQNMCKIMEEFATEEKIEQLVQLLEEGIITEEGLSHYSGITPEQVQKVFELYRQQATVQA